MSVRYDQLVEHLKKLRTAFAEEGRLATIGQEVEALRLKYLGKKGELTSLLKEMGQLDSSERPAFGQMANKIKQEIESKLLALQETLRSQEEAKQLESLAIDITLPGQAQPRACKHPIEQTIDLISEIFMGMGYSIAEGPEIEYTKYNFDLLRIPEGHPARDEKDTFYISQDIILRTQTSPVQIRVMEKQKPPIRIICPGKVYRTDTPDATHSPIFHQVEGLVVDKGVAMSDLVGSLQLFARELFGRDTEIRLRPHHFPFTEPSCEVDVSCWNCGGKGCSTCKGEGFVEVLGAGMVHPWVLENCGIDPAVYSGFAFGIGVERTAMARFDIDDIRNLYENNLSFLKQFK